ncbi:amidohydrolase family protein [Ruminiclostridium cellulolyticum]|uniref:Amidohydrolase 3 n=1 Tax=Ruminiclostridium cellulolyticum (strain ATCC 35319 / DSM 5812 / JCM 6584 / H10) TaxID=394503 RepID=B8I8P8_RUMCH|nr:amidohydrolase family protein [Ruminiclostridium cellulolyticum]ACL75281.1 Amidohydrolase 3 [Ruminiclostridium cellulolyticum H10]
MKKFTNAIIYGYKDANEILVEKGVIKEIGRELGSADEVIDLGGKLVIAPYVDPHLHLDYVYTLSELGQKGAGSGTLYEAIEIWPKFKEKLTVNSVKKLALKGIKDEVSQGVQHIRAQTDVTDPNFTALKAMLELREELKNIVEIQIVAFPQQGMYTYKGGRDLVEEALKMGADVVGGIPHYEPAREFGEKSVHDIVELALKYNKLIDVHCDETDDPQSRFVELLNALVLMEDYGTKTTASHTCSFGSADDSYAYRMIDLFKKSNMNFISCPTENAYLQGRHDSYPKRRGLTRVKEFMENEINIAFAQDSINDPWYPMGNGNMMNILDNGIHLAQIMSPEHIEKDLDLITSNGAQCLNIQDRYGLDVGKDANFIVVDGDSPFDVIRNRAGVLASIRKGEYLFKQNPVEYEVKLDLGVKY